MANTEAGNKARKAEQHAGRAAAEFHQDSTNDGLRSLAMAIEELAKSIQLIARRQP
jgi:hypothetical protein